MPSRRLANYEIVEELGRGGMGVVFKAVDEQLQRTVAIKVLPALAVGDPDRRSRFLREARAKARLNHPNIATIYEIGEAETADEDLAPLGSRKSVSIPYIAMEYVEGQDLVQRLDAGPLTAKEILSFAIQIADGLDAAHHEGVVHRDLKPQNVRITPQGRAKILDFGLAKLLTGPPDATPEPPGNETFMTVAGMIVGTVPYLAPEQIEAESVDTRSDLFAFGVVLYQMITGRLPFAAKNLVDFVKSVGKGPPALVAAADPRLSPELDRIVRKLLQANPEERFQEAAEVAAELKALARRDPEVGAVVAGPRRRFGGRRAAAALAAVALLALLGWWLYRALAQAPGVETLAVLPIANETGDPELATLASAVRSLIGNRITELPRSALVDSSQAGRLRERGLSDQQVARELDADYVISGVLIELEDAPVLQLNLTDSSSGLQLWRLSFERPDLTSEVLWKIEENLRVLVSPHHRRMRARDPSRAATALNLYFKARSRLEGATSAEESKAAAQMFRQALDQDPESAHLWVGLSDAARQVHKESRDAELLAEAEAAANRAVELDSELAGAQIAMAKNLTQIESFAEAAQHLERLLEERPDLPEIDRAEVFYELSIAHRRQRSFEEAVRWVEQALDKRREFWRWWRQLGAYSQYTGDLAQAESAYRRAEQLAPPGQDAPRRSLIGLALQTGDYEAVRELYERIEREGPITHPLLLSNGGTAYLLTGDFERAEELYERALRLLPERHDFWMNLGDARAALADRDGAAEAFRRALELLDREIERQPGDPGLLAQRPNILGKLGRCAGSDGALATATGIDSGDHQTARLLAETYAVCGSRRLALESLATALEMGAPPRALEQALEFRSLAGDPAFEALFTPTESSISRPPRS